jgi:hypothetical protein
MGLYNLWKIVIGYMKYDQINWNHCRFGLNKYD